MPMTCSAYRCNNHFYKGCGKQFFRFPVKDPERLSEWITAIKRKNWKPSESSRICSDHFTDKDYMLRPGATIPRLRLDAVPTVFDDPNKSLRERIKRKKTMETNETNILDTFDVKEDPVDNQDCIPKKKVPMTCSVPNCNNPISKGKGKHFFRFPINNPYRLSAWATAIKLEAWKPSGSSRICSDHFTDKDYVHRSGGTVPRLRVDAVPSVFIKHSEHLEEMIASENEIKRKTHMQPAANKITEVADIKQPLATMPEDSVESVPCSQMDDSTAPKMRSASVSCVPCGVVMQGKNQTEQFNFRRSYLPNRRMCAVKGCKNTGITRRGTCFFRFPIGNPEQLSKWLTAIHRENWTPSVKSRICSGHFTNDDYKHSPGSLIPQLQAHAVPSVFTAKKGRKLKRVKDRTRNEVVPCTDMELQEENPQPEILDHTYYAVQNISNKSSPCRSLSIVNLRRRVKTLQRQTQRQRHTLKKLCQVIAELKTKNTHDHDPGSLSTDTQ